MNEPELLYQSLTVPLASGLRALPIVHGAVEFTTLLRRLFLQAPPYALAIEIPELMWPAIDAALEHADQIPVVTLEQTEERPPLHFILEPLEPLVEALRSAKDAGLPIHPIDFFHDRLLAWIGESFPDTVAASEAMMPPAMWEAYAAVQQLHPGGEEVQAIDELREIQMAAELRNLAQVYGDTLSERRPLLLVCGMRHLRGVRRFFQMEDGPFEVERLRVAALAPDRVLEEEPLEAMLSSQQRMSEGGAQLAPTISALARKSAASLVQPGYFNTAWLFARRGLQQVLRFRRQTLQRRLYRDVVERYDRDSGELTPPQREKLFFRFARNWSLLEGDVLPSAYRLLMAARGFGGDNFARVFYDVMNVLPPLRGNRLPEREITLEELFRDSRMIRFRLPIKRKKRDAPQRLKRRFERERYPGQWREASRGGMCSYPPEDVVIEDFGRTLQKSASALLRGLESRTLPFSSSLMDGIDYRETIRNLHLGRIFVKDAHQRAADAGAVVIIFNEDEDEHPWRVVWWGEHSGESDMAFFASDPARRIVGPGILQSRYGGLMLTHPPGRLHDIWSDPSYAEFTRPADRLLAAAIEYNERRAVVHLSARAPSRRLTQIAARLGQKVVHIPLAQVSPVRLGRIRRFHVLDSRERRDEAGDYIW
ncbi:MAG: hypothetical protein K1X75_14545 [Leptospirales bacterium]|nr:hypothetical protein [Leptospirales bacterium]